MKAPINFVDKVHRMCIKVKGTEYELKVQQHTNDKVWVYPNPKTRNVIRVQLDWREEMYQVQVASCGDGLNFFKETQWYTFDKNDFSTFDTFEVWMIYLIGVCERLFNYGG
jgi:hypothetical protein